MPIMKCPECNDALHFIPAGVSKKTNKPYQAFYSCRACGFKMKGDEQQLPAKTPNLMQKEQENERWDNIGMAKAATALYAACFEHGDSSPEAAEKVKMALQEIASIQRGEYKAPF